MARTAEPGDMHDHDHDHIAADGHGHGKGHSHGNGHDHNHFGGSGGKLLLSLAITGATLIAELVGGLLTGSLALLSDAAHVFLDMFALALSWGAVVLAGKAPNPRHSYGFIRMKVLAAFVNGATLLLVAMEIVREAAGRLANPEPVIAGPMLLVAVIGLIANLLVAMVLGGHDHDDLNARSAFLHVLGDALSSVGVIVAGVVIMMTGWVWVDALASVMIAVIILSGSYRILRDTVHLLNEGAPEGAAVDEVAAALAALPGVSSVHDTHVWSLDPASRILSAHLVVPDQPLAATSRIMADARAMLHDRFRIDHTTIQFECSDCGTDCASGCGPGNASGTAPETDGSMKNPEAFRS